MSDEENLKQEILRELIYLHKEGFVQAIFDTEHPGDYSHATFVRITNDTDPCNYSDSMQQNNDD